MNTSSPICCVAGKSGGHIIPCLQFAVTDYLTEPSTPLLFISTAAALDQKIRTQFPIISDHLALPIANVPYNKWHRLPLFMYSCIKAFTTSFWYLKKHKPTRVISTGGLVGLPVCLAAKCLNIPIDLFELNVIPGKATKVLSTFATNTFVCFKETQKHFKHPSTLTAYPLRFGSGDKRFCQKEAIQFLGLSTTKKTLFILGGSQGSEFLNNLIQRIPLTLLQTYQIIHQTGQKEVQTCQDFYAKQGIKAIVFAYQPNLAPYYQAADFVICRAGAGTLFELLFFKKRSLVIPLEGSTTDHQLDNAQAMHTAHPELFSVMRQQDIIKDPSKFFTTVQ